MRPRVVVVAPPGFNADPRVDAIAKPLQRQMLVAELPIEGFVGAVLPWFARIDEGRFDLRRLQPAQDRSGHEFGPVVGTQKLWRAVNADELREDLDARPERMPPATSIARHSRV